MNIDTKDISFDQYQLLAESMLYLDGKSCITQIHVFQHKNICILQSINTILLLQQEVK